MSLPWKIMLVLLFVLSAWLLYRDVTLDRSPLCAGSERLTTNIVYVTNSVHELGANNLGNVSNNIASNVGILATNNLESMQPKDYYFRGDLRYHCIGSYKWVTFDGSDFRVGYPSEYGRVVVLDRHMVVCVDNEKNVTYLLSCETSTNRALALPSTRFTSSGDGRARAAPW